jgi:hypothetical protein
MKTTAFSTLFFAMFLFGTNDSFSQPVPVEFMLGNRYSTINVVLSKPFTENSRLGFFHLNTLTMNFSDRNKNDLALQNLVFYEFLNNFRITGGAFYGTYPGFSPTLGMQYINPGRKWFILISPRINIEADPTYNLFSIIRYKTDINSSIKLYTSLQALNILDGESHIKSYQWLRLGLEIKGTQFGLSANFDEFGPRPKLESSFGLFIRREIF